MDRVQPFHQWKVCGLLKFQQRKRKVHLQIFTWQFWWDTQREIKGEHSLIQIPISQWFSIEHQRFQQLHSNHQNDQRQNKIDRRRWQNYILSQQVKVNIKSVEVLFLSGEYGGNKEGNWDYDSQ